MKKIISMGILAFLISACASSAKNADEGDIFTELRKLNLVDEKTLTPGEKEDHNANKEHLNQRLGNFLSEPENTTDFPSLEEKKKQLSDELIAFNKQDEAQLTPDELSDLRNQRTKHIDDLQALLEKGQLFMNLKKLNTVNETALSPEDRANHEAYKKGLSDQLESFLSQEENKSSNPDVENRKAEILTELKNMNAQDESTLDPQGLSVLRQNREDRINELLGLLDGSIVPEPKPEPQPTPQEPPQPVTPAPAPPVVQTQPPAPAVAQPPQPAVSTLPAQKPPRGELFEELLKLNTVDEASLDVNGKSEHVALKQDLNRELREVLAKDENKFVDPQEEKEKNDLADELVSLDNQDESQLNPDELQQLRDRRTQIVERLQDLIKNAKRHEAVGYGIVSEKSQGIDVKQEPKGAVDVIFNNLLFAFNKTDLRPSVRKILDHITKYLKEHADFRADIGGHSDNIGPEWAKKKIADGRAENAKRYLIRAGIEEERLTAKGYSDTKPLARPFTRQNRRKNRRVEVHILAPDSSTQTDQASGNQEDNGTPPAEGPSNPTPTPAAPAQQEQAGGPAATGTATPATTPTA